MNNVEYAKAIQRPSKIESSKSGFFIYNYDIQETTDPVDKYTYLPVEIEGEPTYKKCSKAVIEAFYEPNQEFDCINTILKSIFSADSESKTVAEAEYEAYRSKVAEIKTKVKEDFAD